MKQLKWISLLLALVLLCSTAALFSSCNNTGDIALSKKMVDVDLEGYTVVYPDSAADGSISTTFQADMADLIDQIDDATGASLRMFTVSNVKISRDEPTILIGDTGYSESDKVLSSIKGHGFAVKVEGNKIVIVGTTNLLTLVALKHFTDTYLSAGDGTSTVIKVHKSAVREKMEMLTLADEEAYHFTTVHQKGLDGNDGNEYGIVNGTGHDYAYDLVQEIETRLAKITSIKKKDISIKKKADSADAGENELLIGKTNRDATKNCIAQLNGAQYGIFVRDGHLVVTSRSDAGLQACGARFLNYLYEAQYVDEDGKLSILVPSDLTLIYTYNDKWVTDFPKPEGENVNLYRTENGDENSLIYLYTGDGVNAALYTTYLNTLKGDGYAVVTESEAEDSIFTFLYNESEGKTLYVAYNAFKHKGLSGANYPYERPTIRIVSAPSDSVVVPGDDILSPQPYTKITDSVISAVALPSGSVGTGYVMQLEDGRFIVMDGGATSNGGEVTNLFNILSDLNQRATGKPTSTDNPIKIAMWTVSHSHGDHYQVCHSFASSYGRTGLVELEYLLGNYPALEYVYNTGEASTYMNKHVKEIANSYLKPATYIRVHTGQKFYFGNAEVEVIYTPEDMLPYRIVTGNDASVMMRISLQPSENGEKKGDPVSFVWTGDAYRYSGMWVSAIFGDYIQSDMVAVSHHGGPGVENLFYDLIAPEVVWFPTIRPSYDGYMSTGTWFSAVDQHVCREIESVKCIIISDTVNTAVFIRPDGVDLDTFYSAGKGTTFTEHETAIIRK